MFPTGSAGVALVVLRFSVAIRLFVDASAGWPAGSVHLLVAIAALATLCLFVGLLTPYSAAVCCLLECALLVTAGAPNRFPLGMSALTAAVVGMLGPGAYSVDARLFGRQLITIPPGREAR